MFDIYKVVSHTRCYNKHICTNTKQLHMNRYYYYKLYLFSDKTIVSELTLLLRTVIVFVFGHIQFLQNNF